MTDHASDAHKFQPMADTPADADGIARLDGLVEKWRQEATKILDGAKSQAHRHRLNLPAARNRAHADELAAALQTVKQQLHLASTTSIPIEAIPREVQPSVPNGGDSGASLPTMEQQRDAWFQQWEYMRRRAEKAEAELQTVRQNVKAEPPNNPMHFQNYSVEQIAADVGTFRSAKTWYPKRFYDAETVDEVIQMALSESRELTALKQATLPPRGDQEPPK